VAQGFAIAGKANPHFDSYCMVGDGEVQEGTIWEAVMYAGQKNLDNLCLLVDRNNGQLDIASRMVFPMPDLEQVFHSFDWVVHGVDATSYEGVFTALEQFRFGPRNGKPTAIVCHSTKGHGALSDFMNRHKVAVPDALINQELELQTELRRARIQDFVEFFRQLASDTQGETVRDSLREAGRRMHLRLSGSVVEQTIGPVITRRAKPRNKRIRYDAAQLPRIDPAKEYASSDIVTAAMKVFARDPAIISIDADLATTSGLEAGVAYVDQKRAMNVGVAEANMMSIGEAFAALGSNTWVSTFCPFFDWKVLRRIAVGQQERLESIASPGGWLTEGHGLDLTFLATGPDFETRTNGATHMGNDDVTIFDGMGQLRIINVSCPRQLLAIMRWIMEGNRGLVYVRVMRAASRVIYGADYEFEFGKASTLRESQEDRVIIVSSGRGVHEALAAADECAKANVPAAVIDMSTIDEELLIEFSASDKLVVFAEQNNGYIWQNCLKVLARRGIQWKDMNRMVAVNTLASDGRPQFIHSGTYEELLEAFSLSPAKLARTIADRLRNRT
jgi:transketolase